MSTGYIVEAGNEYDSFHLRSDFLPAEHVYLAKHLYSGTCKVGSDDQDLEPVYEVSRLPRCLPADTRVVDTGLLEVLHQFYGYMRLCTGAVVEQRNTLNEQEWSAISRNAPPDSLLRSSALYSVNRTPVGSHKYTVAMAVCVASILHMQYTSLIAFHSPKHYQFPVVTALSALLTCLCTILSVISVNMFVHNRIVSKLYISTFLTSIVPTLTTKELQAGWRHFIVLAVAASVCLGIADVAHACSFILAIVVRALETELTYSTFLGVPVLEMLASPREGQVLSSLRSLMQTVSPASPEFYAMAINTVPLAAHHPILFSICSVLDIFCAAIQAVVLPLSFLCFCMLIVAATARTRSTWRMMSFSNCPISPVAPRTIDIDLVLSHFENKYAMLVTVSFTLLTTRFLLDLFAYVTNTYNPVLIPYVWYIMSKNVISSLCMFFIILFPLARLDNNISHLSKVIHRFQAQSKLASSLRKQWVKLALEEEKGNKKQKKRVQAWTNMLQSDTMQGRTGNILYVDPETQLSNGITPQTVWTASLHNTDTAANSALSLVPENQNRAEEDVQLKRQSDASKTLLSFSFLGWHVSYAGIGQFLLGLAGSATHQQKDKARQLQ